MIPTTNVVLSIKTLFGRSINKLLKKDKPQVNVPRKPNITHDDIIASITSQEAVWHPDDDYNN